jgi:hypothetical protein
MLFHYIPTILKTFQINTADLHKLYIYLINRIYEILCLLLASCKADITTVKNFPVRIVALDGLIIALLTFNMLSPNYKSHQSLLSSIEDETIGSQMAVRSALRAGHALFLVLINVKG